jgi:phosphopantothenoylcysteine decarboxylase / phosphopantothenate---cysteine ligase
MDPVRYISNYSTGKMGFAIAERLAMLGASVILVCGPVQLKTIHPFIQRIDVVSAEEMYVACLQYFEHCNGAVMTAAVADYAPLHIAQEKIKRLPGNLTIELTANRDIAAELGRLKRADQFLVGFALESQNGIENARLKMTRKKLDLIVLNSLKDEGAGFGFDTNKIAIVRKDGNVLDYPLKSKREVAIDIVDQMIELDRIPSR